MSSPAIAATPEQPATRMRESNAFRFSRRAFLGAAVGAALAGSIGKADAASRKGTLPALQADASKWNVWVDPGDLPPDAVSFDLPSTVDESGAEALKLAITGGNRPYTHIHCYRHLAYNKRATALTMKMRWRFSDTTWNNEGAPSVIQMIEPAMNIWDGERRFEWALQWQNVGDGSGEGAGAPAWRIRNGASWETTGFSQRLAPNAWHDLELSGEIVDGAVRYVRAVSDDLIIPLDRSFSSTEAIEKKRMAVTMQLGGNYNEDPYQCYIGALDLNWWNGRLPDPV
jgi:hypothetical protein